MRKRDKILQTEHSRKHYEANKQRVKDRAIAHRKKTKVINKSFIYDYLSKHPCVDCGNSNPIVLEFDHVVGKKRATISDMLRQGYSLKSIQEEVAKCEVRCANCHRIITYQRRQI